MIVASTDGRGGTILDPKVTTWTGKRMTYIVNIETEKKDLDSVA